MAIIDFFSIYTKFNLLVYTTLEADLNLDSKLASNRSSKFKIHFVIDYLIITWKDHATD